MYHITTLKDMPHLTQGVQDLDSSSWPVFLLNATDSDKWELLYSELSEHIIVLYNDDHIVVAAGFTVPLSLDLSSQDLPESLIDIILRGVRSRGSSDRINALAAVGVIVNSDFKGNDFCSIILNEMKTQASSLGCEVMIVPLRPTNKDRYPLQAMSEYAEWRDRNGRHYDSWVNTHEKLNAKVLSILEVSVTVKASLDSWSEWTGLSFLSSGKYIVPKALCPIIVDVENDVGIYDEPNIWMKYEI